MIFDVKKDVKPGNIIKFIDPKTKKMVCKIADLGIHLLLSKCLLCLFTIGCAKIKSMTQQKEKSNTIVGTRRFSFFNNNIFVISL